MGAARARGRNPRGSGSPQLQTIATARASALTGALDKPAFGRILPNRSGRSGGLPKLLQPEQHGQRPLQLAIQVDFVPSWRIQIVGSVCDTEGLVPDRVEALQ